MKEYLVDIDVTISTRIYIDADNENEANKKALEKIASDPYYYIQKGAFVQADIVDTFEENDKI